MSLVEPVGIHPFSDEIFMVGAEQRFAIGELAVRCQVEIDQIPYSTRRSAAHCLGNGRQLVQIVIDDSLACDRDDIAVRRQSDRYATITGCGIFILSTYSAQRSHSAQRAWLHESWRASRF